MHLLDHVRARGPILCGHRGNSQHAPENTLASLRSAAEAGAAMSEIDVRRTADGVFVLMHDRSVDRTTDGTGLVGHLSAAEIAARDAGAWFAPATAGEKVPTLRETLAYTRASGHGLILEIKDRHADDAWLEAFSALVLEYDVADLCLVSSFDHLQLHRLKTIAPALRTLGIAHVRTVDPVATARSADLDAVVAEFHLYDDGDAEALQAAGIHVAYSLPRPVILETADRMGARDTAEVDATLASRRISMLIGDDVPWLADRLARAATAAPDASP